MRDIYETVKVYVEAELNEKYKQNKHINKEDMQIYVELTPMSYYPIGYDYHTNGDFRILNNNELAEKNLYVGSKRQFYYKHFSIDQEIQSRIVIDCDEFKTAWNENFFHIFKNGKLLNKGIYTLQIPAIDNLYAEKCLYLISTLKKGDDLDIYYIENNDSMMDVPFNRDLYISTVRQYATKDEQTLYKVPYPYSTYPRGENMFFILDKDGEYLDKNHEYTTSADGDWIELRPELATLAAYVDFLTFAFPYVKEDWESESGRNDEIFAGNNSGIDFDFSYSILDPSNATTGLVNFYPPFTNFELSKKNFILFGNSTMIDPDRYEVVNNSQLQFLDDKDIRHSQYAKYTMVIFKEQNIYDARNLNFKIEVKQVEATEEKQKIFYIPDSDNQKKSFLAFVGSISMDVHDRFEWKNEINQMHLTHPDDYISKGRKVTFIFYTPYKGHMIRDREISFKKMLFDVTENGRVLIPTKLYDNVDFNLTNILLFVNGTFLQPDRYNITDNVLTMIDPIDNALKTTKTVTGIYLVAYIPNYQEEGDGPYKYYDLSKDRDVIWFDIGKAKPYVDNN